MFNVDAPAGIIAATLVLLPLVGIIDALAHSATSWRAAKRSRLAWVLIMLLLNVLGVLLYLLIARPSVSPHSREAR
jgi:hypothetical protein